MEEDCLLDFFVMLAIAAVVAPVVVVLNKLVLEKFLGVDEKIVFLISIMVIAIVVPVLSQSFR